MQKQIQRENERGTANHGWLKAKYSFSFANYYNPKSINFGALRVLNDDIIQGGMGFGEHPHNNMEIITIPLKGSLKHRDSMSNEWIPLHKGEVQVMSAGKGIQHSEVNNSTNELLNLFQIWILPKKQNIDPRYHQKVFEAKDRENKLQILVSSIDKKVEDSLTINQDAQISRIDLTKETSFKYQLKSINHGVYLLLISGELLIEKEILQTKDAIGISDISEIEFKANRNSKILIIEVSMNY